MSKFLLARRIIFEVDQKYFQRRLALGKSYIVSSLYEQPLNVHRAH